MSSSGTIELDADLAFTCGYITMTLDAFLNQMLAKLGGGRHKPNKQSLLPQFAVPELFETVRIQKV